MEEIEEAVEDKDNKGHCYWPPSYKTENLINDFRLGHHIDEKKLTYPSVLIEGLMVCFQHIGKIFTSIFLCMWVFTFDSLQYTKNLMTNS